MRALPVTIGLTILALTNLFAGCEREPTKPAPATPTTTRATASQPSATELANVRDLVKANEPRRPEGLPQGHPPIERTPEGTPPMAPPAAPQSGLVYEPPAQWQREPTKSPMRTDQYRLPRAAGDSEDGELAVFAAIRGGVEANIARWRSQFSTPDGKPLPDEAVVRQTLDIGSLKVHVVDMAGRFDAGAMSMGGATGPKDNYRMLAAVITAGDAPGTDETRDLWFIKAVGPTATMGEHRAAFLDFLKTLKTK